MTEPSNAEKLRISDGFVVWLVDGSTDDGSPLDPMPEGARVIGARDPDEPEDVDAAIVVAHDTTQLADSFEDVLPHLDDIPLAWVLHALGSDDDIGEDAIQELVADHGWYAVESVVLDGGWAALRIEP